MERADDACDRIVAGIFAIAAAKLIVSIFCTQLNLGHLAPCNWEPVVISLNCLLLSMNSTNETLLFDRFLIVYNLCVFTCIILTFVFHCTHVRMLYVLNSYLLTYYISANVGSSCYKMSSYFPLTLATFYSLQHTTPHTTTTREIHDN